MSELRAALVDLGHLLAALPARHPLPPAAQRPTRCVLEAIARGRDFAAAPPATDRLERAWQKLQAQAKAGRDPAELPASTLRDAIWLLWSGPRHAARLPGLTVAIFRLAERRPSVLARCIAAWLLDFDSANPDIVAFGRLIAEQLRAHPPAALERWRATSDELRLFDVAAGPATLASHLLAAPDLARFTDLGFDRQPRASGGYLRATLTKFAALLPARLRGPDPASALDRAQALFLLEGKLRFDEPGPRGAMADGLVGAWASTPTPPSTLRDQVLRLLTTQLGDPRMQPARWSEASGQTRRIVLAWLTRATFAAFFDLIGRYADSEDAGHHWKDRRQFWSACLDRGWISDSWLVLGDNVRRDAAISRELRGSYGHLVGSRPNHSALLMRIGSTVFAEWSHNGKLHAWEAGAAATPRFGSAGQYQFADLTARGLWFPPPANRPDLRSQGADGLTHFRGIWQGRVARLLLKRDSLRLEPSDWQ
jgi:hypothetical protein